MAFFISKDLVPKIESFYGVKFDCSFDNVGYGEQALSFDDVTDVFSDLDEWLEFGDVGTCYEDDESFVHCKVSLEDNQVFDFIFDEDKFTSGDWV